VAHSADPAVSSSPNEEAVRAWDTVLYERWRNQREIFVGGVAAFSQRAFESDPPAVGDRCIDIGCGFGETTRELASMAGPDGFAYGIDSSPNFVEDARIEAREAGISNVAFDVADAQVADWEPIHDYAFSRMGTQFFAGPVPAMRSIRAALKPGGKLCKIVWRRKADNPFMAEAEVVAERFLQHPDQNQADTCGPGPFSMGNPDTTRGILEAAGFDEIDLTRCDIDYLMGRDMAEAIDVILALGPAAELIRVCGDEGARRKPEIGDALAERFSEWQRPDGSVVGEASAWLVTARNPG
jgi:ubiquinone/menaquinone biosynthesis C-methylase UbiE